MANICHAYVRSRGIALENTSPLPPDPAQPAQRIAQGSTLRNPLIRLRRGPMALTSLTLFLFAATACHAQSHAVVCSHGTGAFTAEFSTGVKVQVGPARNGELATRACEATLSWDKQKLVIPADASQSDIDVFGVNLGLGVPIVAFQVKEIQ